MTASTSGPAAPGGRLAGAAAGIAALTVLARAVGFGRTVVFGNTVGDGPLGDLYQAVNALPNVVFEIAAGGVLSGVVVPLLAGPAARGDRAQVSRLASALLVRVLLLLVPLAALVALAAGPLVALLGVPGGERDVACRLLWWFAPQIPLYGVAVVLGGVLQAHRRFAWPVLAPLLSSVTVIAAYLGFAATVGASPAQVRVGATGELLLAGGTTAGVAVLALCLVPPVRRLGLTWRPRYLLPAAARRAAGGLAAAGLVAVVGQQAALLVTLNRANTGAPTGTAVHVTFAQTVFLLPWAVLAVPVATAAYPRLAAAWSDGDAAGYTAMVARAGRTVLVASALGAALLVACAEPAAAVLVGGAPAMAAAVAVAAPGLLGYGAFALYSRALYARGAAGAAAAVAGAGWAAVVVASVLLAALAPPADRAAALAGGQSVGLLLLGAGLLAVLTRVTGAAAVAGLARTLPVAVLAAAAAATVGAAVARALAGPLADLPAVVSGGLRGAAAAAAVIVVFAAGASLGDPAGVGPLRARLAAVARRRAAG
ncbi:MAG TPA: lipid II flippase MurJ [Pilimelia sp.]|nr:lipid II flippase MurJ [Pilimelia sp.]